MQPTHAAAARNRYATYDGSALTPEQRARTHHKTARHVCFWHQLAKPIVQDKLLDGSLKVGRASKIRMLVPITYELGMLRGCCRQTPGHEQQQPAIQASKEAPGTIDLPIVNSQLLGPPPEWIAQHGRTPKCRVCKARGRMGPPPLWAKGGLSPPLSPRLSPP